MNTAFWKGRSVFLTGHTGFKGSWLSLWLQKLGARVIGFSLEPPSEPNLFDAASVCEGMRDIRGDIRDIHALRKALSNYAVEIVIHMAAESLVRRSYANPVTTFNTNVMGTVNLLACLPDAPEVKSVVIVTSDKCYENREWMWGYRENEAMGGYDPYSCSKGCAELATAAFRRSYFADGPSVATARAGNVIGAGDWADDRLIPDVIRAALSGTTVRLRSPQAVRPWQHVLDPLAGYLMLAERLYKNGQAFAEAWNFGPEDAEAKTVEWVVRKMAAVWGGLRWEIEDAPQPHEAHYLKLDATKARVRLGWLPRLKITDALKWTVEGYRTFSDAEAIKDTINKQLETYMELTLR